MREEEKEREEKERRYEAGSSPPGWRSLGTGLTDSPLSRSSYCLLPPRQVGLLKCFGAACHAGSGQQPYSCPIRCPAPSAYPVMIAS